MKKIKTLMCAILTAFGTTAAAYADDATEVTRLTVTLTSGLQEHYEFPDHPTVTFPDSRMVVTSDAAETSYERSEVASYGFTRGLRGSSITETESGDDYLFSYSAPVATISGHGITGATVFSTSGDALLSARAEDGIITLDLSTLAPGVYILIPDGHKAIKIKK